VCVWDRGKLGNNKIRKHFNLLLFIYFIYIKKILNFILISMASPFKNN